MSHQDYVSFVTKINIPQNNIKYLPYIIKPETMFALQKYTWFNQIMCTVVDSKFTAYGYDYNE